VNSEAPKAMNDFSTIPSAQTAQTLGRVGGASGGGVVGSFAVGGAGETASPKKQRSLTGASPPLNMGALSLRSDARTDCTISPRTPTAKRVALRQGVEYLMSITVFTFDPTNEDFVDYYEGRTGDLVTSCECGWQRVLELLRNPPDDSWKLTRAKMQDCWEIFTGK
jgi:hypothetical protein